MTRYAYIDPNTGAVEVSNAEPLESSQWWGVPDDADPNRLYVDAAGSIAAIPAPPGPQSWWRFDGLTGQWTDPRTPADLAAELTARRAATRLTKIAFCEALMETGFLSPDEAAAAARGEVPTSFADTIASMSAEKRDRARIYWGGATLIERLDPLIVEVGAQRGITPETLDALFGIVAEVG